MLKEAEAGTPGPFPNPECSPRETSPHLSKSCLFSGFQLFLTEGDGRRMWCAYIASALGAHICMLLLALPFVINPTESNWFNLVSFYRHWAPAGWEGKIQAGNEELDNRDALLVGDTLWAPRLEESASVPPPSDRRSCWSGMALFSLVASFDSSPLRWSQRQAELGQH